MTRMVISGEDRTLLDLFQQASGLLGLCFERLGDTDKALRSLNLGLSLNSDNASLLAVRGILLYPTDTPAAVRDLEHAIKRGTSLVGPYYLLAYHFLSGGNYRKCLSLSYEGLRFEATGNVQADFYEWIAISSASLDEPRQLVEGFFRLAVGLAPNSQRIKHNHQLFEQGTSAAMNWQKDSPDEVVRLGWEEFNTTALIAA